MIRAFARTRALKGPVRADVDLAMSKWWGKKRPAEGQVSGIRSTLELRYYVLELAAGVGFEIVHIRV